MSNVLDKKQSERSSMEEKVSKIEKKRFRTSCLDLKLIKRLSHAIVNNSEICIIYTVSGLCLLSSA